MISSRVIPVISIDTSGRAVKTLNFNDRIYIGDPVNAVRIFNEKEVDEICILDIDASRHLTEPNFDLLESIASQAFMPLAYGGGIKSLADIERLFKLGIEKVIINSSSFLDPSLLRQSSQIFGSQSIVACIDVRKKFFRRYATYSHGGLRKQSSSLVSHIKFVQDQGVGEIIINSIDRDGRMIGYDIALISQISTITSVPIVALGGAGSVEHLRSALEAGASAVAAGSLFLLKGPHRAVLISYNREGIT